VAQTPGQAGLCSRPDDWSWSSYRAVLGLAAVPDFLAADSALLYFGSDRKRARERFRVFVEDTGPASRFRDGV